jgi:CBS domain-containing protein
VQVVGPDRAGAIPVASEGMLVGVLDARDVARAHPSAVTTLYRTEIAGRLTAVPVHRILRADTPTVGRRTPLTEAIRLMQRRRVSVVPVTRGEELVGVLTDDVLLEMLAEILDDAHGDQPRREDARP